MKGGDVPASTTDRVLAFDTKGCVAGLLRRAIWTNCISCETLFNEGVDVDAEIRPAVPGDDHVWNSGVHLVCHDVSGAITEHEPSSSLD